MLAVDPLAVAHRHFVLPAALRGKSEVVYAYPSASNLFLHERETD